MSGIVRLFFYLTLIWVIALGFAESMRFIQINAEIRNDMEQMLEQALEAGLDHQGLRSHVSIINENICQEEFVKMVKMKYDLQDHDTDFIGYVPINDDVYYEKFRLQSTFWKGSYSVDNGEYVQVPSQYPTATLEGLVIVKPFFLNVNDIRFTLKFKVDIDNFHAEHTGYNMKEAKNSWSD